MTLRFNTLMRALIASGAIPALDIIPVLNYVGSTTGVAPFGVTVNCVGTTTNNPAINPFHDLTYMYKVSDTGLGNYTNGQLAGTPKNRFVGGPVFSVTLLTTGTQTIDVYCTYDGVNVWHATTLTFTVQDPDVVYPTTATTVVSSSGTFTGAPAGATQVTSSAFDTIMQNAAYAASNKRVLFRDGETFTATTSTSKLSATSNLYVGSFGGSGGANINAMANSITILQGLANGSNPANNANNWRITNLNVNGNTYTGVVGFTAGVITDTTGDANIKNFSKGYFTYHNLTFTNLGSSISPGALGCVVNKCTVNGVNYGTAFSGRIGMYVDRALHVGVTDCNIDCNHGGEHALRVQGSDYGAFISNTLARPAANKQYGTQRGWPVTAGTNIYGTDAQYNNWAYNTFDGSSATVATSYWFQVVPQNTGVNEPIRDVIVEGNHWKASRPDIACMLTAREVSVRNNTIDYPAYAGETSSSNATMVWLQRPTAYMYVTNSGIRIYNNSVYRAGIGGFSFVSCDQLSGGTIGAVAPIVKGNVAYSPLSTKGGDGLGTAPSFEQSNLPLPSDKVVGQNSTDSDIKNTNPLFSGATTTQAGFALQAGSPYKNAAADYKVHIDALRYLRVGPNFDTGACNAPDKQVAATTLIP